MTYHSSGIFASSGGVAISGSKSKSNESNSTSYDTLLSDVKEYSNQINLDSDLVEYVEKLQETLHTLQSKKTELDVIQYLAWNSDQEMIKEARNNLYFATKLCHAEYITDYLDYINDHATSPIGYPSDPSFYDNNFKSFKKNKESFITRVSQAIYQMSGIRKLVKKFDSSVE